MNDIEDPNKRKKPTLYYYAVVLLVLALLNLIAVPAMNERTIQEVDYSTFIQETNDQKISEVKVEDNQILFTLKGNDEQVYRTGVMNDPDLVQRLTDSGATFSSEIVEQQSPFVEFLLTWVLPLVLFYWLWQFLLRRMMGGGKGADSMIFNVGKSNARVSRLSKIAP